jgi:CheY-like chemotaxis protein
MSNCLQKGTILGANAKEETGIPLNINLLATIGLKEDWEGQMDFATSTALEPMNTRMPATILLLDDNAVQAATRQTILKRAGYFVIAALNPARALEQFQANDFSAAVQLVITDHLMPGMTGAEFVRALRRTHPVLPVLVISGLEDAEQEYAGLNVTFRMKPLLPDRLLETVHSLVDWGEAGSTALPTR